VGLLQRPGTIDALLLAAVEASSQIKWPLMTAAKTWIVVSRPVVVFRPALHQCSFLGLPDEVVEGSASLRDVPR
jgi:hypothetical protein